MNAANGDPFRELLELLPESERRDKRRIVIADPQPVFRAALAGLLSRAGCDVRAALPSCAALFNAGPRLIECDFVIADPLEPGVSRGDNLAMLGSLMEAFPRAAFVILTSLGDLFLEAAESDIKGHVLKSDPPETLLRALGTIERGERYASPSIARCPAHDNAPALFRDVCESFTEAENEIMSLVAKGKTSKEMARAFGVKPRIINAHRAKINDKLKRAGTGIVEALLYRKQREWGAGE